MYGRRYYNLSHSSSVKKGGTIAAIVIVSVVILVGIGVLVGLLKNGKILAPRENNIKNNSNNNNSSLPPMSSSEVNIIEF